MDTGEGQCPFHRRHGLPRFQREAEFAVNLAGTNKLMRVGVHAGLDPQQNVRCFSLAGGQLSQ